MLKVTRVQGRLYDEKGASTQRLETSVTRSAAKSFLIHIAHPPGPSSAAHVAVFVTAADLTRARDGDEDVPLLASGLLYDGTVEVYVVDDKGRPVYDDDDGVMRRARVCQRGAFAGARLTSPGSIRIDCAACLPFWLQVDFVVS